MPQLKIYAENNPAEALFFTEFDAIKRELAKVNIDIQKWTPAAVLAKSAETNEILQVFDPQIKQIKNDYGFLGVDIVSMNSELQEKMSTSQYQQIREKFLAEHTHSDDEVRYFIEGSGLFCVHANKKVYAILCQAGDFIAVPAETKHWFDMGAHAHFRCIRFFTDESGWIAEYSGDNIADQFPNMDELLCK